MGGSNGIKHDFYKTSMSKINLYVLASFYPLVQNMTTLQSKGHRNISFLLCVMLSNLWVLQHIKMENGTLLTNHILCFLQIPARPSGFSFCYFCKEAFFVCTLLLHYLSEISVPFIKLENAYTYTFDFILPNFLSTYSKSMFRATFSTLSENPHYKY